MPASWPIPEGIRVMEGPPLEVLSLRLDGTRGEACALLDDGSEEALEGAEGGP